MKGIFIDEICRQRYSFESYKLYEELYIVKTININWLRWIIQVERISETDSARKISTRQSLGRRSVVRSRNRYINQVENDQVKNKKLNIKN